MKWPPLTDRARSAVLIANATAPERGHAGLEVADLMLALLTEPAEVITRAALEIGGVDVDRLQRDLAALSSGEPIVTIGRLPLTPRCKQAVEVAREAARSMACHFIGVEHLLLGCLSVESTVSMALANQDKDVGALCARIRALYSEERRPVDELQQLIERAFTYQPPTGDQPQRYEKIRAAAKDLATLIGASCPSSIERALALTSLRQAVHWANASIACNERGGQC